MTKRVGVIVARFQVPYLHAGHRFIIEKALAENDEVLVVLGESGGTLTRRNPLGLAERRAMVLAQYPNVRVRHVRDIPNDHDWAEDLDEVIRLACGDEPTVTLYGGPDSFLPHYLSGKHQTVQVLVPKSVNGTTLRAEVRPPEDPALHRTFREGMIYAAYLRRPMAFQTVDIAIINDYTNPEQVLLGTRRGDDGLRFPGGFVDPRDLSLEYAARREAREEVPHLTADGFTYLGSQRINDWRYRNAEDKIITALFIAYHQYGPAEAGDDFREARWTPLATLDEVIASVHRPLANMVLAYVEELQHSRLEESRVR